MIHYSEALARSIDDILVNIVFCVLVIAPIAFLSYLQNKAKKLTIVVVFILLSAVVSSFLANVRHKTSLTIIAAYVSRAQSNHLLIPILDTRRFWWSFLAVILAIDVFIIYYRSFLRSCATNLAIDSMQRISKKILTSLRDQRQCLVHRHPLQRSQLAL